MNNINFENDLQQQVVSLEESIQPQRDLWTGIEVSLVQHSALPTPKPSMSSAFRTWFSVVNMSAVTAALIIGIFSWDTMQDIQKSQIGSELISALSKQHESQKNNLLASFEDNTALTPNWQQQLAELEIAASAIKKALDQEPNNIALLRMLQQVHQQQIDLIEAVHAPKWTQV